MAEERDLCVPGPRGPIPDDVLEYNHPWDTEREEVGRAWEPCEVWEWLVQVRGGRGGPLGLDYLWCLMVQCEGQKEVFHEHVGLVAGPETVSTLVLYGQMVYWTRRLWWAQFWRGRAQQPARLLCMPDHLRQEVLLG